MTKPEHPVIGGNMSDTPRTDETEAAIQMSIGTPEGRIGDSFNFARQLERELSHAQSELRESQADAKSWREQSEKDVDLLLRESERAKSAEAKNASLAAQVEEADRIILQLTMTHCSNPEYEKGFEMAGAYFHKYKEIP